MSRRGFWLILTTIVVSLLCYQRADQNHFGRHFAQVLDIIDRDYVEAVDKEKLFEEALEGMLSKLDENSGFIARNEATEFHETLDQKFGGIGIIAAVDPKSKQLIVASPLAGKPAYKAGLRAGDKIIEINGQSTGGYSVQDAAKLLRGPIGQSVNVRVLHENSDQAAEYTIVRDEIQVDSVLGDVHKNDGSWDFMLPDHPGVAYIRITSFGERTPAELNSALQHAAQNGMKGLIIDLRGNPGGLLPAGTKTCELFLKRGKLIVTTRLRDGIIEEPFLTDQDGPYASLPLVAIVNRFSASAAEIVAACLQDHHRAVIVGERSYGKGTVQRVIPVEGGHSILKLTTASYWRPSGKNIHRMKESAESDQWGVSPDEGFEVKLSEEEFAKWFEQRRNRDLLGPLDKAAEEAKQRISDAQLDKAVQCLESKIGPAEPPK